MMRKEKVSQLAVGGVSTHDGEERVSQSAVGGVSTHDGVRESQPISSRGRVHP